MNTQLERRLTTLLDGISSVTENGCWLFRCAVPNTHRRFSLKIDGSVVAWHAHRAMYILQYGEITKNDVVCHRCSNFNASRDYPQCVNPEHLYLGSRDQNYADYMRTSGQPHITDAHVKSLIEDHNTDNYSVKELAQKYGLRPKQVEWLMVGTRIKRLGVIPKKRTGHQSGSGNPHALLDDDRVREIKTLLAQKVPGRELAIQFDVSSMTISGIKTGRTWTHVQQN